jgi:hypothetical protein
VLGRTSEKPLGFENIYENIYQTGKKIAIKIIPAKRAKKE